MSQDHPFRTHLLASAPEWLTAGILAFLAYEYLAAPAWAVGLLLVSWIGKDLLMYPRMRHFYLSQPASQRMVGDTGIALSDLAPHGLVRVRGEIWQAHNADPRLVIPQGCRVSVRDVRGLELVVEPHGAN